MRFIKFIIYFLVGDRLEEAIFNSGIKHKENK